MRRVKCLLTWASILAIAFILGAIVFAAAEQRTVLSVGPHDVTLSLPMTSIEYEIPRWAQLRGWEQVGQHGGLDQNWVLRTNDDRLLWITTQQTSQGCQVVIRNAPASLTHYQQNALSNLTTDANANTDDVSRDLASYFEALFGQRRFLGISL